MAREARKQRRAELTRTDILLAAAEVLAMNGFAATTMADIARAAGFSVPSIYAYLPSKQAVLEALQALIETEIEAVFTAALPVNLSIKQRVALLLQRYITWALDNPVLSAALSSQVLPETTRRDAGSLEGADSDLRKLIAWFGRHSTRAERGGWSAEEAAYAFWGIVRGFFARWEHRREPPTHIVPTTMKIVDFFFHGLGGDGAARSES